MSVRHPDTLLIDIDDTMVRALDAAADNAGPTLLGRRLLALMRDQAVRTLNLPGQAAEQRIHELFQRKTWWDWQDYLDVLGLDAAAFWTMADRHERQYVEPMAPNLQACLERLIEVGYELNITSNNPTSGIRHKLRLAGLSDDWQRRHIRRLLGTNTLRAMKRDVVFWQRALQLVAEPPSRMIVIGDNWHDDVLMPRRAGIRRQVLLGLPPDAEISGDLQGLWKASDWGRITTYLMGDSCPLPCTTSER